MEQLSSFLENLFTQISASPLKAALAYSTAEYTLQGLPTEGKKGEDIIRICFKSFTLSHYLFFSEDVRTYTLGPFSRLSESDSPCNRQRNIG